MTFLIDLIVYLSRKGGEFIYIYTTIPAIFHMFAGEAFPPGLLTQESPPPMLVGIVILSIVTSSINRKTGSR